MLAILIFILHYFINPYVHILLYYRNYLAAATDSAAETKEEFFFVIDRPCEKMGPSENRLETQYVAARKTWNRHYHNRLVNARSKQ